MDDKTALYRFYDPDERLLYVGISRNPAKRFERHAGEKTWWHAIARIDIEWHPTRNDALRAEEEAIKTERPAHNVVHAIRTGAADLILSWKCENCGRAIDDGGGYLTVDHNELAIIRRRRAADRSGGTWVAIDLDSFLAEPRLGDWRAHHQRCDPNPGASTYTIDIGRIRNAAQLLDWTAHLIGKSWIQDTNWGEIVARCAAQLEEPNRRESHHV